MLLSCDIDLLESSFWLLSTYNPTVPNLDICYWFLFCVFELKLIISSLTANIPQGLSVVQSGRALRWQNYSRCVIRIIWRTNGPFNKKDFGSCHSQRDPFQWYIPNTFNHQLTRYLFSSTSCCKSHECLSMEKFDMVIWIKLCQNMEPQVVNRGCFFFFSSTKYFAILCITSTLLCPLYL